MACLAWPWAQVTVSAYESSGPAPSRHPVAASCHRAGCGADLAPNASAAWPVQCAVSIPDRPAAVSPNAAEKVRNCCAVWLIAAGSPWISWVGSVVWPSCSSGTSAPRKSAAVWPAPTTACAEVPEAPIITMASVDDSVEKRVSTVGCTCPETEIKIVSAEGAIVPVAEQGELLTRGYANMKGYDQ